MKLKRYLQLLLPIMIVGLGLLLTWQLARRPLRLSTPIGGADSALLGRGFEIKEAEASGRPYRWTTGSAEITFPRTAPAYQVTLRAESAITGTHRVLLADGRHPLLAFDVRPGPHRYHLLWPAASPRQWAGGPGTTTMTLLTDARQVSPTDRRELGVVLSELELAGLRGGVGPLAALLLVGVALASLGWLLRPWSRGRLGLLALVALGLPLLYELLVWHPPVTGHTWLPLSWLPGLVAALLSGLLLARLAGETRLGALLAALLAALLGAVVLLALRAQWQVDGPDYAWHLNHGGSWERVFRAHGFYPFGFPLVLWLGTLWGDRAVWLGQTTCFVAALITFGATLGLGWRMLGRQLGWLCGALLLASPAFVAYGVLASTDALLVAPATLALLALCWAPEPSRRQLLLGGLLLGIAYLFRFQALLLLLPALLWSLGGRGAGATAPEADDTAQAPTLPAEPAAPAALGVLAVAPRSLPWGRLRARVRPAALLLAGFLIGSAPQWLLDVRDMGRPFYTTQYDNIWMFAYNRFEPLPENPPGGALWFILSHDPAQLWRHWMENLRLSVATTLHELLIWPLGLLALAGFVLALFRRPDRRLLLVLLWAAAYVLAVTLTANKVRFFLPVVPPLVVCAAYALSAARARLAEAGSRWRLLAPLLQAALWAWALSHLLLAEGELLLYLRG